MKNAKLELQVGAKGWQYTEWSGEFYPDDLPEDWRFSYYSNEYHAVLIPSNYISLFAVQDWIEWKEDTQKDFAFYMELPETVKIDVVQPYIEALDNQLKGFVVVVEQLTDIDALAVLIRQLKTIAPVSLHGKGTRLSDSDMDTLQACHEVNLCWDGKDDAPAWGYNESAIILREPGEQNNPDQLRQCMEKAIEYAGKCDAVALFFTGVPPRISDIRTARTITDLLV